MDRLEYLRAAIVEGECTVHDLREYCTLAFQERPGCTMQDPHDFVTDDAMVAYEWLKGWWKPVEDCPKNLELNLLGMLWAIYVPKLHQPQKLTDKIMDFYNRASQFYYSNGIDPNNPQESPEERRRRKQRERMAAVRETRKVPEKDLTDNIRAQVRELEATIEQVKINAKQMDEERRREVVHFQERMLEAADGRKAVAQSFRDELARLRAEIKQLTGKQ